MTDPANTELSAEQVLADIEARALEADADELTLESPGDGKGDASGGAEADRAAEREALSKGWTPKDKFRGEASKWVDAKTFIERGKNFNQNLKNEVATLKKQLAEFRGTAEQFKRFHDDVVKQKDADIAEAKKELQRRIRAATREGDDDLVEQLEDRVELLDKEKDKLKEEAAKVTAPTPVEQTEAAENLQAWIDDGNEWFKTDGRLRAYAIEMGQEWKKGGDKRDGRAFLDAITEQMKEDFPTKFGPSPTNPRRPIQDGGGPRTPSVPQGGKTLRDLPAADRALCVQFVKEGWTTEKAFLESYFARQTS